MHRAFADALDAANRRRRAGQFVQVVKAMEREQVAKDVFISYRWVCPDQEWVRKDLCDALERAGLKVWLDKRDCNPASDIYAETERVIQEARWAICVTSPVYMKETRKRDGLVAFEFRRLLELNRPDGRPRLIPLLLGSRKIPERIDTLAAINWANPAIRSQEWERLLRALQAKNPEAPAPPALRFYFVKLYLCLIISFLRSHLVIAAACLALLLGVVVGLSRWLPAIGGNPPPEMQPSPVSLVEDVNSPRPAPNPVVKSSPTPTAEPSAETLPQAKIKITQIPPAGGSPKKWVTISGHVTGGNLGALRVVIYSYVNEKWYVQPIDTAPFTSIDSEGGWTARIHPGTTYAALLVKDGFRPLATIRDSPASLGDGIVNSHIVPSVK